MNGKELEHAIALGESSTLQFKREWSDNNAIAREIIAFANGKGGILIRAMQDGDNIEFVNDEQGDKFVAIVHRKNKVFGEKFIENNEKFGEKAEKFGEKAEKFGEKAEKFIESSQKKFIESSLTTVETIKELIAHDNGITTSQMAAHIGISIRAVAKHLKNLQEQGVVRRIGPDRGGRWEICK